MLAAELNLETICRASGHLQIKLAANWRHESETGGHNVLYSIGLFMHAKCSFHLTPPLY